MGAIWNAPGTLCHLFPKRPSSLSCRRATTTTSVLTSGEAALNNEEVNSPILNIQVGVLLSVHTKHATTTATTTKKKGVWQTNREVEKWWTGLLLPWRWLRRRRKLPKILHIILGTPTLILMKSITTVKLWMSFKILLLESSRNCTSSSTVACKSRRHFLCCRNCFY